MYKFKIVSLTIIKSKLYVAGCVYITAAYVHSAGVNCLLVQSPALARQQSPQYFNLVIEDAAA